MGDMLSMDGLISSGNVMPWYRWQASRKENGKDGVVCLAKSCVVIIGE